MNVSAISDWKPEGLARIHQKLTQGRLSRRQFAYAMAGAPLLGGAGPAFAGAKAASAPVPIPGGTPALGGIYHVLGPAAGDPIDSEPSTITNFNGFVGLAYISGMVTRTNTQTGETARLPFLDCDMRFMSGVFRGADGRVHQGAFAFV